MKSLKIKKGDRVKVIAGRMLPSSLRETGSLVVPVSSAPSPASCVRRSSCASSRSPRR